MINKQFFYFIYLFIFTNIYQIDECNKEMSKVLALIINYNTQWNILLDETIISLFAIYL